jgi:arabinofuranosyltransferase
MKKHPLWLFPTTLFCLLFILTIWSSFQLRKTEKFTVSLENFRSDFLTPQDKDSLIDGIISKEKRFVAFGNYVQVSPGEYKTVYYLESPSPKPADLKLQIAEERGKSVLLSQEVHLQTFPTKREISFKINLEKEIEPRALYSSGNKNIRLRKVTIEKIKSIFPWGKTIYNAIFYSICCTLILLSVYSSFRNTQDWKYFLAAFLFFIGCFLILRRAWMSEDAFITLRHVGNFIKGYGPVFNVQERVEGFTHPLWFFVVSFFRWLGLSPKGAAILPGLLASFTALYLLFFRIRFRQNSGPGMQLNPAAAILIGTSAFVDFGTSGLETSLSYLLLVLYAKFLAEERWLKQPVAIGLICTLLTLSRPDFGIFLILIFLLYLYEMTRKRAGLKHLIPFLLPCFLFVGGYQIFRMGYYAAIFPNPFYAKSGSGAHLSQGIKYLWDFCQGSLFLLILFLVFLAIYLSRYQRDLKARSLILFSGLLHGFFVIRGGGDFMHGRFLLPAFLLLILSLTGSFDRFFEKKIALKNAFVALFIILFFLSLHVTPVQQRGKRFNYGISDERSFYYHDKIIPLKYLFTDTMILMWKTIGINYRDLSEKAKLNIRIAYKNVGFTGFYAGPHVYVLDKLGLTDSVISRISLPQRRRPGHEKYAPFGYLVFRQLTFHDTPFPLWNKLADSQFGVLWDLSAKTLKKFDFFLEDDFKKDLDSQISNYLNQLEKENLPEQADFLFFLKQFWYPHASDENREFFRLKYQENIINQYSGTFAWIQENRKNIHSLLLHIQGPVDAKGFFKNIRFALTDGLGLKFTPIALSEKQDRRDSASFVVLPQFAPIRSNKGLDSFPSHGRIPQPVMVNVAGNRSPHHERGFEEDFFEKP